MKIHYVPTVLLLGSAVLILLLSLGLMLTGRVVRRSAESFRSRAVTVTATVVELEAKDLSLKAAPDTRYFPRVRYQVAGTDEPIEEISWLVGYEDPSAFRRLFQRIAGISPGQYRRQFAQPLL